MDELRVAGIQASLKEHLMLLEALEKDVIAYSPEEFYYLSRATLVKDEGLLDRFDQYATEHGLNREVDASTRPEPTAPGEPQLLMNLDDVDTIIWATGFKPNYPWLDAPVLDRKGAIIHDGGLTPLRGMYVLGLPVLRSR